MSTHIDFYNAFERDGAYLSTRYSESFVFPKNKSAVTVKSKKLVTSAANSQALQNLLSRLMRADSSKLALLTTYGNGHKALRPLPLF